MTKKAQTPPAPPTPPPAGNGSATPPAPANGTETAAEPRKRNALSKEKRLAVTIAGLIAIFVRKEIAALLTAEEKTAINAADAVTKEINAGTLKPIDDRLEALKGEIAEAAKVENLMAAGGAEKLKGLTQEMTRLQNKRKSITEAAASA